MPPKPDKSQDGQTSAQKQPKRQDKGSEREARLAEALRANLRRRKQGADKKKDETDG